MDSVHWTRRKLLSRTSIIAAAALTPQNLLALQAGSPATPFSRFTDVAATAGLTNPSIYGETDHATYILENLGGGCAFFDYDNDGWMDIFVLGGRRLDALPPGSTNRLYRNNRDGTFTDVTEKAGLIDRRMGDRRLRRRLQQRRIRRSFPHLLRPKPALSQQRRWNLYRRHGKSGPAPAQAPVSAPVHFRRLQPRRPARSVRLKLRRDRSRHRAETFSGSAQLQL